MHKYLKAITILAVTGAALLIVQLWFELMPTDIFIKAEITLGIIIAVLGFLIVVTNDMEYNKRLKDKDYLD